jgi:predicted acetyltransferase
MDQRPENEPRLIVPDEAHLASFLAGCREFLEHGVAAHFLPAPDQFDDWSRSVLQGYRNYAAGTNLPPGYVPASTFWLVAGDEWLGVGNIRHRLTPSLRRFGGHIGYAIRYSRWGQGYGTLQLRLLLAEARRLGIERALVTCDLENRGSARVSEMIGGLLEDVIDNEVDGRMVKTCRYWVDTAE